MWFRFPEGTESCAIEQQSFTSEFRDTIGRDWFRAPDHFAPAILGMGVKGLNDTTYESLPVGEKPKGCEIDDLTPTFGAIGAQIGEQAQVIASLRGELTLANETIQKITVQQRQAESEVMIMRPAMAALEKENANLKARIGDFESEQETREALAAKAKAK